MRDAKGWVSPGIRLHVILIFNFNLADVYNKFYNPTGKQSADAYTFPFADGSFDIVYGASLFTHLVPSDTQLLEEKQTGFAPGRSMPLQFFRA